MFSSRLGSFFLFLCVLVGCAKGPVSVEGPKKIGVCIVATGKYDRFVPDLINSARTYFLKGHEITFFVFTDGVVPEDKDIVVIPTSHLGWPGASLKRFHIYDKHKKIFSEMDYLYAMDADMRFVEPVREEVLGKRVAVSRDIGKEKPYEKSKKSTAYVNRRKAKHYFAGAFYGGEREEFLKMVRRLKKRVEKDLQRKYIAKWHDESYLNRYLYDHPPKVLLNTSYCYLEKVCPNYPPKIIALDKTNMSLSSPANDSLESNF